MLETPQAGLGTVASISFTASSSGWAVNDQGSVFRYRNGIWSPARAGDGKGLEAVWALDTEAWAVGSEGAIFRISESSPNVFTTSAIASGTTRNLFAVHGFAANDVWFAGQDGVILHWDGTSVSPVTSTTSTTLRDLWGPNPNLIYAVGDSGTIRRYDGLGWGAVAQPAGNNNGYFQSVTGTSATDLVIAGSYVYRFNGTAFTQLTPSLSFGVTNTAIAPDGTIWVTGPNGRLSAWPTSNNGWSTLTTNTTANLWALAFDGSLMWAAGAEGEWLTRVSGPSVTRVGNRYDGSILTFAGTPPDLLAVGLNGLITQRGTDGRWTNLDAGLGDVRFESACKRPSGEYVLSDDRSRVWAFTPPGATVVLPGPDAGTAFQQLECLPNGTVVGVRGVPQRLSQWLAPNAANWVDGPTARWVAAQGNSLWSFDYSQSTLGGGTVEACARANEYDFNRVPLRSIKGACNYFAPAFGYDYGIVPEANVIYARETDGTIVRQHTDGGVQSVGYACGSVASTGDAGLVCVNTETAGSPGSQYTVNTVRTSVDGGTLNAVTTWYAPVAVNLSNVRCFGNTCWAQVSGGVLRRQF